MPSLGRILALLAASASIVASSSRAHAYCRTTTEPIPAGYDPTATGCITQGVQLAWPSMPVTYQLEQEASVQVSLDVATPIFDRAFAKWTAAACSATDSSKHPALSFDNAGPTDAGYTPCDGSATCENAVKNSPHTIVFRDGAWPHNDPANTLALTTVTFGVDTGHIYAADMEINSHEHTLSTTNPPAAGAYSLEAIATHEAGHFVGIAHSQVDTAIMFAQYQPNAVTLKADDVAAVCDVYPPATPAAPGCSCRVTPPAGGAIGLAAATLGLATAIGRRRRRTSVSRRRPPS